jgi:hypothetical protein
VIGGASRIGFFVRGDVGDVFLLLQDGKQKVGCQFVFSLSDDWD